MLGENEEHMMTGISDLFSGQLSVVYEVFFGHICSAVRISNSFSGRLSVVYEAVFGRICSAVRMNHGSRASVLVWRLLVEMPAYTLSYCLRVLCAMVSMHDA